MRSTEHSSGIAFAVVVAVLTLVPASSSASAGKKAYVGDVTYVSGGGVKVGGHTVSVGGDKSYDTRHSLRQIRVGDWVHVRVGSEVDFVVHVGKQKAYCETLGSGGLPGDVQVSAASTQFMYFQSGQSFCGTAPSGGAKTLGFGLRSYVYIQHDPVLEITASPRRSVVKVRRGLVVVAGTGGKSGAVVVGKNQQTTVPAGQNPQGTTSAQPPRGKEKTAVKQVSAPLPPASTDTKGPSGTVVLGPHDPSSIRVAAFSFASEPGATLSCALDGTDFRLCARAQTFAVGPGTHTLVVRATDAAGNTGKPSAPYSWTVDDSRIAFDTDRDGRWQIYTADTAGGQVGDVSDGSSNDYDPSWSPDGKQIAFHSDRAGSCQIYVVNAAGGNVQRVTFDKGANTNPSWSRFGRIAYESDPSAAGLPCTPDTGNRQHNDIYTIGIDGSGRVQVTQDPADDIDPAWSPDGTRIAFASNRSGAYQIYVVNADGTGLVQVSNEPQFQEFGPAWSPDGKRIAFNSTREGNSEIFVVNADGSEPQPVARALQMSYNPSWAPDGEEVAFQSLNGDVRGRWRVYWSAVDPAASLGNGGAFGVTGTDYQAQTPAWSPQ